MEHKENEDLFAKMFESYTSMSQDLFEDEIAIEILNMEEKDQRSVPFSQRRHITITQHAKLRLQERVGNHEGYRNWQELVQKARYKGTDTDNMTETELTWMKTRLHNLSNTAQVRMLNGFAYIFKGNHGHARTLVTVINMNPSEIDESDININLELCHEW